MPPIETGQKQRTHYLAVHTETLETYCTFKQQALKIAPTANYELSATVHGNVTLVDNYTWQCFTGNDPHNLAACSDFTQSKGSVTFNADSGQNYFFYLTLQRQFDELIDISMCYTAFLVGGETEQI